MARCLLVFLFCCIALVSADGGYRYCPINPQDGSCSGLRETEHGAGSSSDSMFFCDRMSAVLGSTACQVLSEVDGHFPITTAVLPSGLPVLFYSRREDEPNEPLHVGKAQKLWMVRCLAYDCSEVDLPVIVPMFNSIFAVDTALAVNRYGEEVLVFVGAGHSRFGPQLGSYEIVYASCDDSECNSFQVQQLEITSGGVNARISSKLVELEVIKEEGAPDKILIQFLAEPQVVGNYYSPSTGLAPNNKKKADAQLSESESEEDDQQQVAADHSQKGIDNTGDIAGGAFGGPESLAVQLISCPDSSCSGFNRETSPSFCQTLLKEDNTYSLAPKQTPYNQKYDPSLWQNPNGDRAFTSLSTEESWEVEGQNALRDVADSPFVTNRIVRSPLILTTSEGRVLIGLKSDVNVPTDWLRTPKMWCDGGQAQYRPDARLETGQDEENSKVGNLYHQVVRKQKEERKKLQGGVQNIRFLDCGVGGADCLRCPDRDPKQQEDGEEVGRHSINHGPFRFTPQVPSPDNFFQYNGLSSTRAATISDATSFHYNNVQTAAGAGRVLNGFNAEASTSCDHNEETQFGMPPRNNNNNIQRSLGLTPGLDNEETFLKGTKFNMGHRGGMTSPHSLVVGLAGNGLPALLGVVTATTGDPSAAGWSLVLTVCTTVNCDQQIYRYLMDSSALHDNWGMMDDPFASVNHILNHPDGSWSIVLFVQPQGEQVARNEVPVNRGEGSSGKPLFINCLDDTCSSAYVSTIAPNRVQSSMPNEYYDGIGGVTQVDAKHAFNYVGPNSEYLLVTVRDQLGVPPSHRVDQNFTQAAPVRFWKTNRYASPTGTPCTPESVGTQANVDSSLFICTRLNTGHDLNLGGISGWVRYYEWVDVSHSLSARLWANIPAGRSPMHLTTEKDVTFYEIPGLALRFQPLFDQINQLPGNRRVVFEKTMSPGHSGIGDFFQDQGAPGDCNPQWQLLPDDNNIHTCVNRPDAQPYCSLYIDFGFRVPLWPVSLRLAFSGNGGLPDNSFLSVTPISPDGQLWPSPVFVSAHDDFSWNNCESFRFAVTRPLGPVQGVRVSLDGPSSAFSGGSIVIATVSVAGTLNSNIFTPTQPALYPTYNSITGDEPRDFS